MQENTPVEFAVECGIHVPKDHGNLFVKDDRLAVPMHKIMIRDGWHDPENPGDDPDHPAIWRKGDDGHIVDRYGTRSPRGDDWRGDIWPLLQMFDHAQEDADGSVAHILMGATSTPCCTQFMLEIYGQDDSGKGVQRLSLDRSWWTLKETAKEETRSRKKALAGK